MDCSACKDPVLYEPFVCMACEKDFCMFCVSEDPDIVLCKQCHDIQTKVKTRKKTCAPCHFEGCHNSLEKQKYCQCGKGIGMCKDHLSYEIKCMECGSLICNKKCREACLNCGHFCVRCSAVFTKDELKCCNICFRYECKTCLSGVDKYGIYVCSSHISLCKETKACKILGGSFKVKKYKCEWVDDENKKCCKNITCTRSWFGTKNGKDVIKVCHQHTSKCKGCHLTYPLTRRFNIKFRGTDKIDVCRNCYRRIQTFTDILILKKFPKDIIDRLAKYYFETFWVRLSKKLFF